MIFFVYGTLKQGYSNHRLMGNSKLIGTAKSLTPSYNMAYVGFPYLFEQGSSFVSGELYEVTDERVVQNLDWLEGHPSHFRREVHKFVPDANTDEVVEAWVYLNPRPNDYTKEPRKVQPDQSNVVTWASHKTVIKNAA